MTDPGFITVLPSPVATIPAVCGDAINETFRNGVQAGQIMFIAGLVIGGVFIAALWIISELKKNGRI
jgi:hypothetical protein